jgi:hypothetical protein
MPSDDAVNMPPDLDDALASLSAAEMAELHDAITDEGFSPFRLATATHIAKRPPLPDSGSLPFAGTTFPVRHYLYDEDAEDDFHAAIMNAARFVLRQHPTAAHDQVVREIHELLLGPEPLTRDGRRRFLQSVAAAIAETINAHAVEMIARTPLPEQPVGGAAASSPARPDTTVAATTFLLAERDPAKTRKRIAAIEELKRSDPDTFAVFMLAAFAGASHATIAELLDRPLDNVDAMHQRGDSFVSRHEILAAVMNDDMSPPRP